MKQIIILLLMPVFFVTGFAQKISPANPGVPCCSVIAVNPSVPCCSIVTTRDNATGRTFEFTVDNSIAKSYKPGTALNAQPSLGIIKSINGTVSKYQISEPVFSLSPCCGIISIEPGAPCCSLISVKGNESPVGDRNTFSVPKSMSANLKIGQKVSIQHFIPVDGDKIGPVDGDKFQPVDGYAVVQSSKGALPGLNLATYSFPILKSKSAKTNDSINDKQWVITQNPTAKGATGKLFLNIPKEAESVITIYNRLTETTQQEMLYSSTERSFSLVPGLFNIRLSGSIVNDVPVQKGMDTRIKAGVLNVVASGTWTLFNEKKSQDLYYSSKAKKIGLPIGTYQMEINGTMQLVVIKDGETVDF